MTVPWLGTKRVAFVPLFRSNAIPPDQIPPDWENVIRTRVLFNPRPEANGADRSLRAWLYAVSVRRADIDPLVLPMQTIDSQIVLPWDLDGRPWQGTTLGNWLRGQGVHAAQLVMLGGRGAGTSAGFWSRVVMAESNGVWLMELIHSLTRFADLYPFANDTDPPERNIGYFDQMSTSSQTHPTIFTKNEIGWSGGGCIGRYTTSGNGFILMYNSLAPEQTPPDCNFGGVFAVRIGDGFPYVMVEARRKSNQFENGMPSTGDAQERGIPSEGVIAYRVQTQDPTSNVRPGGKVPLYLMTQTALEAGQSTVLDGGINLTVTAKTPKGFIIRIFDPSVIVEESNVIVPWLTGANATDARQALEALDLVADFSGPVQNSEVINQMPDGNTVVMTGSTVHLLMHEITYK
jgi:hypothetical protein